MLQTRLRTAAIALPAALAVVIFAPALVFSIVIGMLAGLGLYEIAEMTCADQISSLVIAFSGGVPALLLLRASRPSAVFPVLLILVMALLVVRTGIRGPDTVTRGMPLLVLESLWVGVSFPYFAHMRNCPGGVVLTILTLLLVAASDSGAYFAGRAIGRVKLLPKVSPNKTVEGAIAGLGASILAGLVLRRWLVPALNASSIALVGFLISLLAQFGDLTNSAIKRIAGVKDSGWIFPGHGGLLDRACSLVFAGVFAYYYLC